jgi:hypothetical protein
MLVLDRTGSMCQFSNGSNDPNCTDLVNAKNGMRAFLGFMDPTLDKVGLAVFPPAHNASAVNSCPNNPSSNTNYYGYDSYWPSWVSWPPGELKGDLSYYTIVSLSDNYLVQGANGSWVPNQSSWMFQSIGMSANGGCIKGNGTTHYASAIEEAQHELSAHGRGDVQDVIIFLSDGAANTSPRRVPSTHWRYGDTWLYKPCGAGVQAAANAKASTDNNGHNLKIYTIGYDLEAGSGAYEKCRRPDSTGHYNPSNPVESGYDAFTAIKAMASQDCTGHRYEPACFYLKPFPGDLRGIFTKIAADLQRPAARLIDDSTP